MIVLIDNGHGKNTKGKCSPDALKGLYSSPLFFREYEWAREIAARIVDELRKIGIKSFLLVPEENDVPLSERVAREQAYSRHYGKNNVMLVSIHANAAGSGGNWMTAKGWSAFTSKGVTKADELAKFFYEEADKCFAGRKIRRYGSKVYEWDWEENFYILKNTACPAVLTENFFQDNKDDVMYLKSDEGKSAIVKCHVDGIVKYIASLK